MEKFKYEVHPRIPIRTLFPGKAIIRPTQFDLSKDEVKIALKHGPVYRVFDRETLIRVTLYNLDELHVAKYNAPKKETVAPSKKTTTCETIEAPAKEVKVEEAVPVVEEVKVEAAPAENVEPVEEPVVEEVVEEKVEEDVVEAPVVDTVEAEESVESVEAEVATEETAAVEEEPVEEKTTTQRKKKSSKK